MLTGRADRAWRPDWGDVAVSIRSQGRFTAGRVRLLPHVTVLALEWGRGSEPRVSKVATSPGPPGSPHAFVFAEWHRRSRIERSFAGLEPALFPEHTGRMAGSLGIEPSSFRFNKAVHSP